MDFHYFNELSKNGREVRVNVGEVVRRTEDMALVTCFEDGPCLISPACVLQQALRKALAAFLTRRLHNRRPRVRAHTCWPAGERVMDVAAWRREKRAELYAAREALTAEQRHDAARQIAAGLDRYCADYKPERIGLYWPIKHEPNLLAWARERSGELQFCLPVVVERRKPLEYWHWTPGDAMRSGVWGIQVPAHRDVVMPDLMIAPLVGFDRARYRLGNGGGYFDRTLAALADRPFVIGVGYSCCEIHTIYPQQHDILMDMILTERW
jgi:5,10-methenyltetrahydrofolate synthetase